MIYFIVTTCLTKTDFLIRKNQYISSINKLISITSHLNKRIIIVENNGSRNTFLNTLGPPVIYTINNFIETKNKGIKELKDVLDCIDILKIKDDDFIVKITGRYLLSDDSHFIKKLNDLDSENIDCIIKYGSYMKPLNYKVEDSITGLIGMRCKYVKNVEMPCGEEHCVEWNWGKTAMTIPDENVYIIKDPNILGINICPAGNNYSLL